MKAIIHIFRSLILLLLVFTISDVRSQQTKNTQTEQYITLKGKVCDAETKKTLPYANITINESYVATVSNAEGRFIIKIPQSHIDKQINFSFVGYFSSSYKVDNINNTNDLRIELKPHIIELSQVDVKPYDALDIIRNVRYNKVKNYGNQAINMTGFYRETIKKRHNYASLSEAVVNIYKQSYQKSALDQVELIKGRKSSDVSKMDTLLFKLQGGPTSALSLDIIKDPTRILSSELENIYKYSFNGITIIDGDYYYIIDFEQYAHIQEPLFFGTMYIHTQDMALASIQFSYNLKDKEAATRLFIKRKPAGAKITPIQASYLVKYRKQGDLWYYDYARADVGFKVKWKKRLFKSNYYTSFEMAITDKDPSGIKIKNTDQRIKSNSVMSDKIKGFADVNFWGEYNVIEPEKSIESAIKKIQKNLTTGTEN